MRALILWADPHSTNLGVRVLHEGTRLLLETTFPSVQVASQSFGAGDAPTPIGTWQGHARRLVRRRDDALIDWVRGFDVVVDTRAGDSFTDAYGLPRLATMGLMGEVARRAGVPLVLGPQTIGPFSTRRGRAMARRTLATSRLVLARDDRSAQAARDLGCRSVERTSDVVFALPDPGTSPVERDVVLNPSGLLWDPNPHVDHERYRTLVVDVIRSLRAQGRTVSLLAHVLEGPLGDNDVRVVRELSSQLEGVEAIVPTDLTEARRAIASARVVIGARMHACLNALSLGVPAVPLAYSRKFAPLLASLGWNTTIDLRREDDPLAALHRVLADEPALAAVSSVRERAWEQIDRARAQLAKAL